MNWLAFYLISVILLQIMKQTNKETTKNKIIVRTALITFAVLLVLVLLISSFIMLLAPMTAGNFFYKFGMEKASANFTYKAANKSGEFEDWYTSLVRGVNVQNATIMYISADKLEKNSNFEELIKEKNLKINGVEYKGANYVKYNKAKSGAMYYSESSTELTRLWNYVYNWMEKNKFNEDNNPLKGYIDGLCVKKTAKIDYDEFLIKMDDFYNRKNGFSTVELKNGWLETAMRPHLAVYVVKLVLSCNLDNETNNYLATWMARY